MEVEGEGSRLRKIQPDELITRAEGSYMKNFMFLDLRIVNKMDSIKEWKDDEMIWAGNVSYPSYAYAIVQGVKEILPAAAVIKNISKWKEMDYRDPDLEHARATRLRIEFG